MFKKSSASAASAETVGALLEVLPGHTEQEVRDWLQQRGASDIESLAPGFLSATATPETLHSAESMCRVEIKHRKSMHRG